MPEAENQGNSSLKKNFAKTLKELKTTNKIVTNNSSDARHYKQNTGHSKQDNNKYQQKRFLVNRGRTFNPPKSTASQGSASFKKKFIKTQVGNFPSYNKDHLIPYLRLKFQSLRAGQVSEMDAIDLSS